MSGFILYHNPRWGKSRGAVSLLNENNVDYTLVEYLKNPLTKEQILVLAEKLGKQPGEFVRKKEADFRENNLSDLVHDSDAMAAAMAKFPKIMERPIFVAGEQAAIGRPLENILSLIS